MIEGIVIVLIWLVAPFVELGIIIALAISNSRYKKRIQELTGQGEKALNPIRKGMGNYGTWNMGNLSEASPAGWNVGNPSEASSVNWNEENASETSPVSWNEEHVSEASPVSWNEENASEASSVRGDGGILPEEPSANWSPVPENRVEMPQAAGWRAPVLAPVKKQGQRRDKSSRSIQENIQNNLGTIALIIGVVFVVLSGTIFATTTWHVMPDYGKALLVLAAALLFFGASFLAENLFHIHKTGNGFYILGSVFLFLFCLATAYFKLLGPGFILDGTNRWRVLWVGSLVLEGALFGGLVRFHDRFYTQACLWGMTVSMCFMAKSFQADWTKLQSCLMLYAFGLTVWQEILRERMTKQNEHSGAEEGNLNGEGIIKKDFSTLLAEGFQTFVPIHFWVLGGLTVFCGLFGLSEHLIWNWFGGLRVAPVSLLEALAIGAVAARIGYLAWKQERNQQKVQILFALTMAEFVQYAAFCVPVEMIGQLFLASGAMVFCLWAGRKKNAPVSSLIGDGIYTVLVFLNGCHALLSSLMPSGEIWELLAASGIIILLAVTASQWTRENRNIRMAIPVILWFLTITLYVLWKRTGWPDDSLNVQAAAIIGFLENILFGEYEKLLFWFLCGLMVWDIGKQDLFCLPVLVIGTLAQTFYFFIEESTMPFALVMSACLFLRGRRMATGTKIQGTDAPTDGIPVPEKDSLEGFLSPSKLYFLAKAYSLAGCYFLMCNVAQTVVWRMTGVNIWFAIMQAARWFEKEKKDGAPLSFSWKLCGCVALLVTMAGFYDETGGDAQMAVWRIALCLAAFYGYYLWFFKEKQHWFQLLAVFSILPMPFFLMGCSWFSDSRIYAGTAVVLLVSGLLFRYFSPILKKEEGEGWQVDWYHVLAILTLGGMAIDGTRQWCFWYLLLAALYCLQFAAVEKLIRISCFLASCFLAAAFWEQPFIQWPDIVALELRLLPAALLIALMRPVWGKSRTVKNLQTLGYVICLTVLILDALHTSQVADALMLEGICLTAFIWAQVKKDILWVRISGGVILLTALFMTKEFWLSVSWWVYLLAAGIGLIVFAAVNEKKRK